MTTDARLKPAAILASMKRVTIVDVARACGVAKSTVSVVLNDSPSAQRVAAETRERVRQVAQQLSYKPSWRGRVLAGRGTHVIGVVYTPPMPLIARGNYEGILSGINEVLQSRGYHLLLMPLGESLSEWRRILLDGRIDGAIVLSRLLPQLGEIIQDVKLPVSLVNADTTLDMPCVLADDYAGSREMVEYLISLGHRRIAFLLGEQPPHYSIDQRRRGYEDAMNAAGLAEHIRVDRAGAAQSFGDGFLAEAVTSRPTAVVCYTHYLAIKLLQVLWEHDLVVPRDVSVCCFSNAYPVADVIPPLTTVALATEQMGRTAAELLIGQIESRQTAPKRKIALQTKLVVRKSTAPPTS
jgi:LacI family transcriptional regulator